MSNKTFYDSQTQDWSIAQESVDVIRKVSASLKTNSNFWYRIGNVKTLENKLSYTSQAKTETVFCIEELTGETLSYEKKQMLEMVIDGDKILQ